MVNYSNKHKKKALALAFGVIDRGSMLHGIPGNVPRLAQFLACTSCDVKLSRGVPVDFKQYMTEEQLKLFKEYLKGK